MKTLVIRTLCVLALIASVGLVAQAEVKRKRYTFEVNPKFRRAALQKATTDAKKAFIRDYLSEKFAPNIIDQYAEDIDIALDPPDDYLLSFEVVSSKESEDGATITLTVEGQIATAEMIAKLVEQDVLSFGDDPPKIMVLPSSQFESPSAAKAIRALIFDKVKQAGLRPVAFEAAREITSLQVRPGGQLDPGAVKILARKMIEYNADYLVYIDTQANVQPFSQGGYIADANFTYTVLRPNANAILGESIVSARGNGSNAMLAFDRALDEASPALASSMLGNLYEAIYADSDVITDQVQLKTQVRLKIHEATALQINAIVDRLKGMGATVELGTADGVIKTFNLETTMDDEQIFEWFNAQKFAVAGKTIVTPVIAYAENMVEVEAVPLGGATKRSLAAKPKPRPRPRGGNAVASGGSKPQGGGGGGGGGFGGGSKPQGGGGGGGLSGAVLSNKAKITLKLKPAKLS